MSQENKFQAHYGSIFQSSPYENVNCDPKEDREQQVPQARTSPSVTGILYCGLVIKSTIESVPLYPPTGGMREGEGQQHERTAFIP